MQAVDDSTQTAGIVPAYLGLILIWSTTPLAVVLSLRDVDALWALGLRMLLAAVLASACLRLCGLRLEWSGRALKLYAIGALSMFGAMALTYLGARHLASGMIAVLFGLSPLVVGLLSRFFLPGAALSLLQWLGMCLGLGGLLLIFMQGSSLASLHLSGVALVLAGVLCYACSALWLKRMQQEGQALLSPLVQTAGALWVSALCSLLLLPFLWHVRPQQWPHALTLLAILYSASLGSIVAMLCYFFLLRHISVSTMALTTLLTPVFALLLGVVLNHERFHAGIVLGMALILLGLVAYYEAEIRRMWRLRQASLQA